MIDKFWEMFAPKSQEADYKQSASYLHLYVFVVKNVGQLELDGGGVLHNYLTLALGENGGVGESGNGYVFKIDLLKLVSMHKGLVLKSLTSRDLDVLKTERAGFVLVAVKVDGKRNAVALAVLYGNVNKTAVGYPLILAPTESEKRVGSVKLTVLNNDVALNVGDGLLSAGKIEEGCVLGVAVLFVCGRRSRLFLGGKASSEAVAGGRVSFAVVNKDILTAKTEGAASAVKKAVSYYNVFGVNARNAVIARVELAVFNKHVT